MIPAVSLEGVSKRYRILASRGDRMKKVLSLGRAKTGHDFWALQDVSLDVEPGTALGILGRNGAGKSTLLKIVSGVVQPSSGTARVNGRLVALLQLGAGFNDDFTGRENIMLNGLILGIDRREMLERLDEIEDFADIGQFVDQPLKTYSSGMRARLGFAVAVNVKPDVLIVDESLATGDAVFKAKGIQKMRELMNSGITILFVSHSTNQVQDFCTEAVLLHKGRIVSRGETEEVIGDYQDLVSRAAQKPKNRVGLEGEPDYGLAMDGGDLPGFGATPSLGDENRRGGTGEARIKQVELLDDRGLPVRAVDPESTLTVRVQVRYAEDVEDSIVGITLRNEAGLDIFSTNTDLEKTRVGPRHAGERVVVDFTSPMPLKHGHYHVAASVLPPRQKNLYIDRVGAAAAFDISRPAGKAFPGLVHLPTRVKVASLPGE